ncbi:energy-coupling factor ABC transporter ATP-binding protein [Streptomyces massasporeus]|uniref:energy-coupling factor ABC transporter ATP-binding protein n=1 Tax=Streptomyces massasporeus TaxID=67324 RepID=UPI0036F6BAB4
MFSVRGVDHFYGEGHVLRSIDVELTERRVAVVGANGSGKSTFARLLNGLLVPTRGDVTVGGFNTRKDGKQVKRKVGFVFQDPDLQIVMPTVAEDVAFGLRYRGLSKSEIAARVTAVLAEFGLSDFRDHLAHQLSGGQKQTLAIASVLALTPQCVVFDEPTTMLDLRNKHHIAKTIRSLSQHVVVVSHDLDLLMDFDRMLVFDEGRIVADGSPKEAAGFYRELMAAC